MKTLTQTSLDAMAKLLPELDEDAQRCIVGGTGSCSGSTGSVPTPTGYTFEQMDSMIDQGAWTGGFVDGYGYFWEAILVTGRYVEATGTFPPWLESAAQWVDDHFDAYMGAEGAITYGAQVAGAIKNVVGGSISPKYIVLADFSANTNSGVSGSSCEKEGTDVGIYKGGGVSYKSVTQNGNETQSISIGFLGFGASYSWDDQGNKSMNVGLDVGGKVAAGYGAEGELKAGVYIRF